MSTNENIPENTNESSSNKYIKNKDITKEQQKNWIAKYVSLYTMIVIIAVVIDNQQATCGTVSHRKILI